MPFLHKFVTTKPDGPDPSLVNASNWNTSHVGSLDTIAVSVYTCSGNFVVQAGVSGNCVMLIAPTGQQITVQLPPASGGAVKGVGNNQVSAAKFLFKNISGQGSVVIQAAGSDKIELLYSSYELDQQFQYVELTSDGGPAFGGYGWWITDGN
jgi:hypothetical protein